MSSKLVIFLQEHWLAAVLAIAAFLGGSVARQLYSRFVERAFDSVLGKIFTSRSVARRNLTGIWKSSYEYQDNATKSKLISEHFVVLREFGSILQIESLKNSSDSKLRMKLNMDGGFVTGTWREVTSQKAVYHGAIQLIISPDRKRMQGKWLGYSKKDAINVGSWGLGFETADISSKMRGSERFRI